MIFYIVTNGEEFMGYRNIDCGYPHAADSLFHAHKYKTLEGAVNGLERELKYLPKGSRWFVAKVAIEIEEIKE